MKRSNHRMLLRTSLFTTITSTRNQAQLFKECYNQIIGNEGTLVSSMHIFRSLNTFSEIGYQNSFNAFLRGIENIFKRKKELRLTLLDELWNEIEFVKTTMNEARVKFNSAEDYYKLYGKQMECCNKLDTVIKVVLSKDANNIRPEDKHKIYYNERLKRFYDNLNQLHLDYQFWAGKSLSELHNYTKSVQELNNEYFNDICKTRDEKYYVQIDELTKEFDLLYTAGYASEQTFINFYSLNYDELINTTRTLIKVYRGVTPKKKPNRFKRLIRKGWNMFHP